MIRVERDPAFWVKVASHPALDGALLGLPPEAVGSIALRADVMPLAAEHGGFFFARSDRLGFSCELHTLFTPEGWGREVLKAGTQAISAVWLCGYQNVTTFEVASNPRSRPPKTFGFVQCGDWRETPMGPLRLWTLNRLDWNDSPAARRSQCH